MIGRAGLSRACEALDEPVDEDACNEGTGDVADELCDLSSYSWSAGGATGRAGLFLAKSCEPIPVAFAAGADPLLDGPAGKRYVGRWAYMGSVFPSGSAGGAPDISESLVFNPVRAALYKICVLVDAIGGGEITWL